MNYLTEILAFYKWLETHPISPLLQAYWHLLMYYNNKAAVRAEDGSWHWPVDFKVPNTVLMPLLGVKDRRVLLRQRGYPVSYTHLASPAEPYRIVSTAALLQPQLPARPAISAELRAQRPAA